MDAAPLLRALLLAIALLPMTACDRGGPVTSVSPGMRLVQNATASGLAAVVEFGAETCASCRETKTVLDRVARQTQGRAHVVTILLDQTKGNPMKSIKILGTGCAKCRTTIALVEAVAKERGVEITLEKVESLPDIMGYGVMSTPGVVIDGQVVHAGGVPTRGKVEGWL